MMLNISCALWMLLVHHVVAKVITDPRIRDPSISPALGRGFSSASFEVLSTCLNFKSTSQPTYNYDYSLLEVNHLGETISDAKKEFANSLGWGFIRTSVFGSLNQDKKVFRHHTVLKMSMERYYSSLLDTETELNQHALSLIKRGDLIGFFQSCGNGYIRSIRRTAEFIALFELQSNSSTEIEKLAENLRNELTGNRADSSGNVSSSALDIDLRIKIKGFGLGLNMNGSETMIARNLEDFYGAAKFAFKSMQNQEVGMIHGVEIVDWASNVQFQDALQFETVESFSWKNASNDETISPGFASPNRKIVSSAEARAISMINSQFINSMESFYKNQLNYIMKLQSCYEELHHLNHKKAYRDRTLVDHTNLNFDENSTSNAPTVSRLLEVFESLDALNQKRMSSRIFLEQFYSPCMSRLSKTSNKGRFTKYWFDFDMVSVCAIDCLAPNRVFLPPGFMERATCIEDPRMHVQGNSPTDGLSIDNLVDMYCMPEFLPLVNQ